MLLWQDGDDLLFVRIFALKEPALNDLIKYAYARRRIMKALLSATSHRFGHQYTGTTRTAR